MKRERNSFVPLTSIRTTAMLNCWKCKVIGTYVVLQPLQLGGVELLVMVEPLDIVVDLLDRLIDLLTVSRFVGHLGLQNSDVESCQLQLAGRFLLLLQLFRHVDRAIEIDNFTFHFSQ